MNKLLTICLLLAIPALTAGCGNRMWEATKKSANDTYDFMFDASPTTRSYHDQASIPLIEINHQAGDVLYTNIGAYELSKQSPVYVRAFVNKTNPADNSPFGQVIMEQVSDRLVQRGVVITQGEPTPDAFLMPRGVDPKLYKSPPKGTLATLPPRSALLTGSYVVGDNYIYLTAKITRLDDKAVVSGHNWTIPITDDVRELMPSLKQDKGLEPTVKGKVD